jgi:hypothetical protein
MTAVPVRIVGNRLPGRHWSGYEEIHVGLQRGTQPVALVRADAPRAVFDLTVEVVPGPDGGVDYRGSYVQGRRGERFVYLTWGELDPAAGFRMFRRAKLTLSGVTDAPFAAAVADGGTVEADLDLTDERGGTLCAAVRPPLVHWRLDR